LTSPTNTTDTPQSLATAAIAGLELNIPESFQMGKSNKSPEFLAKFPLGKIPAFEGADGFLLTEGNAIALYLAESAPSAEVRAQLLGDGAKGKAQVARWVWFAEKHLEPAVFELVMWRFSSAYAQYHEAVEKKSAQELTRSLGFLESELGKTKGKFLDGADKPSLGDLAVANQISLGGKFYIDAEMRKEHPNVMEWWERVAAMDNLSAMYKVDMIEKRKDPPAE
jgi:elongation factor 1-gamma